MKILIAEDNSVSLKILEKMLTKWGYEVIACSDGSEAWKVLRDKDAPTLAILDWIMPGVDGLEVCRRVRKKKEGSYIYIIVLTAKDKKRDLLESMEAGADDYIKKPFDNEEVKVRLRAGKRILKLQKELIAEREAFKFQATHDLLTGLPNRILLNDRLVLELARAKRYKHMTALLYLDLDRFKVVNDTLGHIVGDKLLKNVAKRLVKMLRKCDTISRLGGDEFILILPQVKHIKYAVKVSKRILKSLKPPFNINGRELYVTTSIGIVLYPDDGEEAENLLKNADTAMYRAKEQGKNNYQIYSPVMNEKALEMMVLENNLRRAVEREEFVLHYQPQIDLKTGKIIGVESLIRWQHPELGLVSPMEFIPMAEETGLISPISEWVLKTACKQNKIWQEEGYSPVRMAVNLSAREFRRHDLLKMVSRVLKETKLDSNWLDLEITESDVMKDPEIAISTLRALRNMGINISIDDFGTGYSSLNYLKQLPINTIKIDRSFIRDITVSQDDAAITSAIIGMSHTLKLEVLAEGVETEEQLKFLRPLGCNVAQGFLFSKPLESEKIEKIFAEKKYFEIAS